MKHNILDYIKYISRRNLIVPCTVLLCMLVLFIVLPFSEVLKPETVTDISEVLRAADSGSRYVHLELENLIYTGYDYSVGTDVKASYYYILDEDADEAACIFFLVPEKDAGEAGTANDIIISGNSSKSARADRISHYSAHARILKDSMSLSMFTDDFADDIGWSSASLNDICKGLLVSSYDYHSTLYMAFLVLIGIVILICLVYIIINVIIYIDPTRHEASRRLTRFGLDGEDFTDIDRELAHETIINAGNMFTTDHYFIAFARRNVYVVPLFNIIWAYKYSTYRSFRRKGRMNYTLVIVTSPRDTVKIPGCKKKDADRILNFLDQDFSHITVGYSDEIRADMEKIL